MTVAQTSAPTDRSAGPDHPAEILPALPPHLDFLFEERPLLPGEDLDAYHTLLQTIVGQVRPVDAIDALWVKDIIDLIWEAKRLRSWRGKILTQARLEAITTLVMPVLSAQDPSSFKPDFERRQDAEGLAIGWLKGTAREVVATANLLEERGLDASDVTAEAFRLKLNEIERIDRMIAAADQRRDALLREIERKRAGLGRHLRAAAADVIDVEPPGCESPPTLETHT